MDTSWVKKSLKIQHWGGFMLIFILAYLPIFYNLTKPGIYIWDEAIYANNALEMAINKDFLVLHNNGQPTLYNVKPPLVIWLQCINIWIFGANEFSIRFPSALAALLTCFVVFYFARRNLNSTIGLLAVLFLITSQGYIRIHVARSGDLDSVLVLFITSYTLLFFDFLLQAPKNQKKYIILMGLLVFCAFLSKSVAGLVPIFGLFVGVLLIGRLKEILQIRLIYPVAVASLFLCVSYYILREYASSGYLEKVISSEYLRFSTNVMPWHEHPFDFYLVNMHDRFFKYYLYFLPLSILGIFHKNSNTKLFSILGITFCVSYFLLISYPKVKLEWYDAPLYPMFSLLLGMTLYELIARIRLNSRMANLVASFVLVSAVFFIPYHTIYRQNLVFLPADSLEYDGFAMRQASRIFPTIKEYKVLLPVKYQEHIDQANFYIKSLNQYKGYNIKLISDAKSIEKGDIILCSNSEALQQIRKEYAVEEIATLHQSQLFKILNKL